MENKKASIKILHLYNDIMNLYGEYGNIVILKKHLEDCMFDVDIETASFDKKVKLSDYDFIYMGSGTEFAQKLVLKDIVKYKSELKESIENNKVMLFTGNSFEMLGKEIYNKDDKKNKSDGLGIFDFIVCENFQKRYTSDAIFNFKELDKPLVGFINKCTTIDGIKTNAFNAKCGYGNYEDKDKTEEGIFHNNFIGTHLIGPVLVKNPHFLEYIIKKIISQKNMEYNKPNIEYVYEENSYSVTLKELSTSLER